MGLVEVRWVCEWKGVGKRGWGPEREGGEGERGIQSIIYLCLCVARGKESSEAFETTY